LSSRASALLAAVILTAACRGGEREILVTYFNGQQAVSLRYPSGWRTDQAEQDGIWYRYFLAPPAAPEGTAAVSVTLLAGPMSSPVEEYAQSYLAGNEVASSRDEERQGARGRSWMFASPDGGTRQRLLLVALGERFWGLYAQGEAAAFESHRATIEEIWSSFTLERPELYPEHRFESFGVTLGVPESWRETRQFSARGETLLVLFASPALSVQQGQTVHASLTMTVETLPDGEGLEWYYESTRARLGDNLRVLEHTEWGDGYMDVMRTETSLAVSYIKRFYRVAGDRGLSLAFEGRDDVFWRVDSWADLIASTLQITPSAEAHR
jgi:hypothetical protein